MNDANDFIGQWPPRVVRKQIQIVINSSIWLHAMVHVVVLIIIIYCTILLYYINIFDGIGVHQFEKHSKKSRKDLEMAQSDPKRAVLLTFRFGIVWPSSSHPVKLIHFGHSPAKTHPRQIRGRCIGLDLHKSNEKRWQADDKSMTSRWVSSMHGFLGMVERRNSGGRAHGSE